ncbi:MAG TPA: hypothetical protein VK658_28870 [Chryseolinea sp.]|nr:hypothetical protein [Chryseolinea sp.]
MIQSSMIYTITTRKIFRLSGCYGALASVIMLFTSLSGYAQEGTDKGKPKKEWEGDGEIEDVEIKIVTERQITLPEANRNFDKIPPRASEPIKPPISYDFKSVNFQPPPITMQLRPLKLKQEGESKVYGGFLRAGFGNYTSPLLEAYYNTTRDKNKLLGAHAYHQSSDRGPVDGRNSGSGSSGINVFGKTFNDAIALSGDVGFENRTTHFYGYPEGMSVDPTSIKQSYNLFKLYGDLTNASNSDFSYKLGAGFSHLNDKFSAKETQFDLVFRSAYELNEDQKINIDADYTMINRKDVNVDVGARNLFVVTPSFQFEPVEDLKLRVGFKVAYENDTIDNKDVHVYPDIEATYPITPSLDVFASLTGGIEKVSLRSLSYENLWLAPGVPIFHTNKAVDFTGGIKARLGSKVSAHAGLSMATLKNYYYFINAESDQAKFDVVYDQGSGTRRVNFFVAMAYAQSEKAKFMLRGDFFGYKTSSLAEPWHRPTYRVTANGSYNVYDKILLSANIIAQGGMKAWDPATDKTVKLDAAFDLNFKAEYLFSQSFSLFVQLNNITSTKYPLFLNYPARGFQAMAGITWSF